MVEKRVSNRINLTLFTFGLKFALKLCAQKFYSLIYMHLDLDQEMGNISNKDYRLDYSILD